MISCSLSPVDFSLQPPSPAEFDRISVLAAIDDRLQLSGGAMIVLEHAAPVAEQIGARVHRVEIDDLTGWPLLPLTSPSEAACNVLRGAQHGNPLSFCHECGIRIGQSY